MTYRGPDKPYVRTAADDEREARYFAAIERGETVPIPASLLIKRGKEAMTCRFELEFKDEAYPRSCPTCGLSGKCHKGYEQIKKEAGGYTLVNKEGLNNKGLPIGMDGLAFVPHEHPTAQAKTMERINAHQIAMAEADAKRELAEAERAAKEEAHKREHNPKAVRIGDRGLPSGDKLRVPGTAMFSIPVNKRLKLIGYLADNFDQRGNYTVHELDSMVDKIAAILLDD